MEIPIKACKKYLSSGIFIHTEDSYSLRIKLMTFSYIEKLNKMFCQNITFSFIKLLEDFLLHEIEDSYLHGCTHSNHYVFFKCPNKIEYAFISANMDIKYVYKYFNDQRTLVKVV